MVSALSHSLFATIRPPSSQADQSNGVPRATNNRSDAISSSPTLGKSELTEEEKQEVEELKRRDREVRRHEQAHKAAAGSHATGAPQYEYEVGPDGQRYAVGGEVQIDTSPVPGDPEATIRKMQQIQRAARAPSEPSSQDLQVAAKAAQTELQARQELMSVHKEQSEPGAARPPANNAPSETPDSTGPPAAAYATADRNVGDPGRFIDTVI